MLKIYIASSWGNQHAVELLTNELRKNGHMVFSFVENENLENSGISFEEWLKTKHAETCFRYDTRAATTCDLVIYISPSGKDSMVELGMAWASKIPIYGLWTKKEDLGLMRKIVTEWFTNYKVLIDAVNLFEVEKSLKTA